MPGVTILFPVNGKGERFRRAGFTVQKPLIPIYRKPLFFHVVDRLALGPEDRLVLIHHRDNQELVDQVMQKYPFFHTVALPNETAGAAETVYQALLRLDPHSFPQRCLILDCDTFYTQDIVHDFRYSDANICFYMDRPVEEDPLFSYIDLTPDGQIQAIAEKQKISQHANTGAYGFADMASLATYCDQTIVEGRQSQGEFYLSCVIDRMLQDGVAWRGVEVVSEHVFSIGTPAQLQTFLAHSRTVLFDLDGTLVITDEAYYHTWHSILRQHEISLTREMYHEFIHGRNDRMVVYTLLPHLKDQVEMVTREKDIAFSSFIDKVQPIPGAMAFVQRTYQEGHQLCLVTNANRSAAESILRKFDIHRFFDGIIIGSECTQPKPFPDPYRAGLQLLDASPETTIIFEDSKPGILSALGVQPALLVCLSTGHTKEELLTLGAQIVLDAFPSDLSVATLWEAHIEHSFHTLRRQIQKTIEGSVEVVLHKEKLKGGYISDVLRGVASFQAAPSVHFIVKMENRKPSKLADMAVFLGLYEREYYFYEAISRYVPIQVPQFHGLVKNDQLETIGLCLEDLFQQSPPVVVNLDLNREPIHVTLTVVQNMAKLHANFWAKPLQKIFPQLRKPNHAAFRGWQSFLQERFPAFLQKWRHHISPLSISRIQWSIENFDRIQDHLSQEPFLTLCHGDIKSPNIFYQRHSSEHVDVFFIDWQYISHAKGTQDLVFFLIESFTPTRLQQIYRILMDYYYIQLQEQGVDASYSYDAFMTDVTFAACYFPLFVAVWFGTTKEEDLVDVNFPFFFIQRYDAFLMHCLPPHAEQLMHPSS